MQSMFNRRVAVRAVLAASALALASCSDSDDSGSGLNLNNTNQSANPMELVDPPEVAPPPDDATPNVNLPVTTPPVTLPPVAPPVTPPETGSAGFQSLYGRATFEARFTDTNESLRFNASFDEGGLVTTEDGEVLLQSTDTGIYTAFVCDDLGETGSALFLCAGIFAEGDFNLFAFELVDGFGRGIFEECFGEQASDFDACFQDFTTTPDGVLAVSISPVSASSPAAGSGSVLSASEFRAMMDVQGQATRFSASVDESADAAAAFPGRTTRLRTYIADMLD